MRVTARAGAGTVTAAAVSRSGLDCSASKWSAAKAASSACRALRSSAAAAAAARGESEGEA
eukprot:5969620-Prorocentrum_lima.AAC.1